MIIEYCGKYVDREIPGLYGSGSKSSFDETPALLQFLESHSSDVDGILYFLLPLPSNEKYHEAEFKAVRHIRDTCPIIRQFGVINSPCPLQNIAYTKEHYLHFLDLGEGWNPSIDWDNSYAKEYVNNLLCAEIDSFICASSKRSPRSKAALGYARNKLYIILSPSGYGKGSMMDELRFFSFRRLRKTTTRPLRIGETHDSHCFLSHDDFKNLAHEKIVLGLHKYKGNYYGILNTDIENAIRDPRPYILDSADIQSAFELNKVYPHYIELVALRPPISFAGHGLEQRIINAKDFPDLNLPLKEQEKRAKQTIKESRYRLEHILREDEEFRKQLHLCDYVLTSSNLQTNIDDFCRYALKS